MLAAAAMLVATAAVMVAAGGTGVLGPLGDLIGGAADRADTRTAASGTPRDPDGAIVAGPASVALVSSGRPTSAPAPRGGGSPPPGRDDGPPAPPVARVPPPVAAPPASAPSAPVAAPPGAAPPAPPATPPRAVDRVEATVDQVAAQSPEPVKPVLQPVRDVVAGVARTCREQLPLCP